MSDDLTLEELSAHTGEPPDELRRWRSMGLLRATDDETFPQEDEERVRVIQLIARRGIDLEALARAEATSPFLDDGLERIFRHGPTYSLSETAGLAGVDVQLATRYFRAANLLYDGARFNREDMAALRGAKRVLEAGLPEEALLQVTRAYAHATERAAEAGQRAFHFYVHERMRAAGMSPAEQHEGRERVRQHTLALNEPTLLYHFRKADQKARRSDLILHVAEELGLSETPSFPGQVNSAVLFVDLSDFTPLSEAMGDVKAAAVLDTFSLLVRDVVHECDGQVIKQIGDEFMLVFPDAASAVNAALGIEALVGHEPQFPAARSGIHWGQVLYREGDYLGAAVNLAKRVASEAGRHQVLVTAAVRDAAKALAGVEFVRLGKRKLKGVAEEVDLYEARQAGAASSEKTIDPVCGMELGPAEVAARLTLDGVERTFCSDSCLRQFVVAPERYGR
jgi:class 3 adenylate cyclase/YHS domain-containing protein